ncbi:hypothetical protein BKA67DRAFT_569206 [Truncatella angustata]|uniref:BZIP domain-containing protein n=1 Tax=Truncatella angustata TaxID=152316 RepID=A0A9P8UJN4_9PEZI|nr:uncharacterized protein BKA67DRAFT_569206 [Truncatella angustata]KAH6653331.1 hypothetical protein BKA67DRAFT_569206 [Truncatella angustata]KAH8197073.1 hypothetical protein TruAng_008780 [Truncatella angustata]
MNQHQTLTAADTFSWLPNDQAAMSPSQTAGVDNEDWTQIADLTLRRRIQNRIAQRNYRNKLKRRLQDLESSAANGCAKPEQTAKRYDEMSSTKIRKKRVTQKHVSTLQSMPILKYGMDGLLCPQAHNNRDQSYHSLFPSFWTGVSPDQINSLPYEFVQYYSAPTMTGAYFGFADMASPSALSTPPSGPE